ncbi:MAG: peptidoglycan DD-metalloendopeptidase family protein [Deltaproteobacteria bacterium]|nr:peptidoglycan DD-metalloendopeptidase family protein [Deltaproteobacteria bacterium]
MKRLIIIFLYSLALFGLLQPGFAVGRTELSDDRDQIVRIEEDLLREKEQFVKFREKEKDFLERLTALEKEIEEKQRNLQVIEESAAKIKKELVEAESRLTGLENALRDVEARLGRRLESFYRYAKRGYARILTTARGLDSLRRRIKYLTVIMKDDLALMRTLAELQGEYRREIVGVQEKLAVLEELEKKETSRMAAMKEDIDRRVVLLVKIHKEKEFYKTAVEELELAAENLKTTLLSLEKESEENPFFTAAGFEESRGKLPLPLNGKVSRGPGRNGPKGILIEAPYGTEVKAVFPGRVDFSGALKGYGQVILINHGSRYFTVSAQLGKRIRTNGEMVKAGDVIGFLAETGSPEMPRLYFEIRMKAGNMDPLKWLKVH